MRAALRKIVGSQETGLVVVLAIVAIALTLLAGSHVDRATGASVNNFWNSHTLIQTATDASFFAIMAIGATIVIISGGIDLSVGSIYALTGVTMALVAPCRSDRWAARRRRSSGSLVALGVGLACGLLNGALVVGLRVHPFIITLGTMWMLRGIAFVATQRREHPRAVVAHGGDEGVAGARRRALSGADAGDDRRRRSSAGSISREP